MTLQSFPRGGKKPQNPWSSKSLYKKPVKKRKSNEDQKQKKKKQKQEETDETNLFASTAERLSRRTICEGLTILGRVHEVTEYHLLVSLPGSIIGIVLITDISESYTNLIQNIVSEERSSEFKSLPELYNPGDYVVCFVKQIEPDSRWQIKLSLEPRVVNQNVDISYIGEGSKMACAVSSVEEHVYVVDTGINNVRAFIQKKDAAGKSYFPGKQLLCSVKEVKTSENTTTLKLSTEKKYIEAVTTEHLESLDNLVPGIRLIVHIKKILSNGLQVSFGKDRIGYINQLYLDKRLESYVNETSLAATLMYIMPTVKFGYFTLLAGKSDKWAQDGPKLGAILTQAKVLFTTSHGVVLELMKTGVRGFVALKRTETNYTKMSKKFPTGSTHRCRVMSYNWMENLFMCSMQRDILEQKHFALTDFVPGEIMNVKIEKVNMESGFVNVRAGPIKGYVAPEQVSDAGRSALKKLTVHDSVRARVLGVDEERGKIRFTMKKSLIESNLPVLSSIQQAKIGSVHHGTIVKINKYGLLVRFYGEAKGWLNQHLLNKGTADVNWNYSVGQTIRVRIEAIDNITSSMDLSIADEETETAEKIHRQTCEFVIGEEVTGTITDSSVRGVYILISKHNGNLTSTGFLPAGHMSPCMETAALLAAKCVPGDVLSALVFATTPNLILSRTFISQEQHRDFNNLKIGDCIPCSVRDIATDGLRVILPISNYETFGFVKYNKVTNFKLIQGNPILFGKITAINRKQKQIDLSMKLKEIYESEPDPKIKMMAAVDALSLYLNKLSELAQNSFYANRPISSLSLGQVVKGSVTKITDDGLILQLENNVQGIVRKDHYQQNLKVGDNVTGTIMWINYVHELADITLIPVIMKSISPKQNKIQSIDPETLLRAEIIMATSWFVLIVLKGQGKGSLAALPVRHHINDLQPDLSPYILRKKIRCYVMLNRSESDVVPVCMLKSAFEVSKLNPLMKKESLKRKQEEEGKDSVPKKKLKTTKKQSVNSAKVEETEQNSNTATSTENKMRNQTKESKKKKKKKKKAQDEKENTMTKNDEVKTESNPDSNSTNLRIPECGFFWDTTPDDNLKEVESSSDSEEEVEEQPKQKKKKLSAAERREQERQKERETRQREEALASNQLPNSVDQFDRLVLASPDSSLIWLQYMAYHLQATEIEKARAVAKRALKTINFREENEKLNVWNAWLNLESKFGTPETLNDVFQEAVRTNDALKVYMHMLTVHIDAGRQTELEKIVNTMVMKFKRDPQVWIECGAALLKSGLKDRSRHIMQRALQSLAPSQHVNLMVRFANLESKFGDKERSQTLFEQVLSSYPKRVDVWCSYVDSLVKSGGIELARKVLERAVVQTLPPSKMKTLFKKFISFEEAHGTTEAVTRIQQMAADYVEKQCNRESV